MNGPTLITGASGLLGRQVSHHLSSLDHDVVGLSHTREGEGLTRLDLTEEESVRTFLGVTRPGVIVHCAAERRPDQCEGEPEKTQAINVKACETLAQYVEEHGAKIVYISTDYVFDGKEAPYEVDAAPNPLNAYGHSKLAGEKVFLSRVPDQAVVLRVPILYGPVEFLDESQVTTLAELVKSGQGCKVDDWATRYPTYTPDVAQAIGKLLEVWQHDHLMAGVQHFSGSEALTKYGMCKAISEVIGCSSESLIPDPNPPSGAPRPQNSQLSDSSLGKKADLQRTPFKEALKQIL